MSSHSPIPPECQIYVLLGVDQSSLEQVLGDLLLQDLAEETRVTVATAPDCQFSIAPQATHACWTIESDPNGTPYWHAATEDSCRRLFIVNDPKSDPLDLLEALAATLAVAGYPGITVITVVASHLCAEHTPVAQWYQRCIHFSDAVILAQRHAVSQKWLRDFQMRFERDCYPCMFIPLKKHGLDNPSLLIDTPPRRISQAFDEPDDDMATATDDAFESIEVNEALTPQLIFNEPLFEKLPNGKRRRPTPTIVDLLPSDPTPS